MKNKENKIVKSIMITSVGIITLLIGLAFLASSIPLIRYTYTIADKHIIAVLVFLWVIMFVSVCSIMMITFSLSLICGNMKD